MRFGLISISAAVILELAFTTARAQSSGAQNPPPIQAQKVPVQCPPGVTGPCWKMQYTQGNRRWVGGQGVMVGDPLGVAEAKSCNQDSDCQGSDRCNNGYCSRFNMACNSDSDCKYSEFCDTARPFHPPEFKGTCAPQGGHYPN